MTNTPDNSADLTIFMDGRCPLCALEMRHLKARDKHNRIALEDINADDFVARFPFIDVDLAMNILHGRLKNGDILLGLDVTHQAWSLVGFGYLTAFLRWPLIRPAANLGYRFFARNRHKVSKLITGKSRLEDCEACSVDRGN